MREDITHSFYEGTGSLHPFEGRTVPIDPLEGRKQGKYTWAKSPRYEIPGVGSKPLGSGPARSSGDVWSLDALPWQDSDPLFRNAVETVGPNVLVRVMAHA